MIEFHVKGDSADEIMSFMQKLVDSNKKETTPPDVVVYRDDCNVPLTELQPIVESLPNLPSKYALFHYIKTSADTDFSIQNKIMDGYSAILSQDPVTSVISNGKYFTRPSFVFIHPKMIYHIVTCFTVTHEERPEYLDLGVLGTAIGVVVILSHDIQEETIYITTRDLKSGIAKIYWPSK